MRVLIAFLLCVSSSALSAPCAQFSDDDERLACYDKHHEYEVDEKAEEDQGVTRESKETKVSNENSAEESAPRQESSNNDWTVRKTRSQLTDESTVMLATSSDQRIDCGRSFGAKLVTLLLRCKENTTVMYLATHCHLTDHRDYGEVDWRIDKQPMRVLHMDESTDHKALGLWVGSQSIPQIKKMFGAEKLTVRFTPYSGSPETVTFPIAGLEEAIKPLRETCHW